MIGDAEFFKGCREELGNGDSDAVISKAVSRRIGELTNQVTRYTGIGL